MDDLAAKLQIVPALHPAAQAASTVNGPDINTRGFREAIIIAQAGDFTTGTADLKVQTAPVNADGTQTPGTYADFASAVFTQFTGSNELKLLVARFRLDQGKNQFIRVVSVVATATSPVAAVCILHDGNAAPNAAPVFSL